jgi:endo-1,4-beta-xylanase
MQDTAFPDAFKWAHEADPQAQLCINDFSLIEAQNGPKLMKIIKQRVLAHGAPIHCIGIQVGGCVTDTHAERLAGGY